MLKWLIAAFGVLLITVGAYTAAQGWSIVQVERGWSQVIAGAGIATGGCIILALAGVAARIDALLASVDQIRRGALPLPTPVPVEVSRGRPAQLDLPFDREAPKSPPDMPPAEPAAGLDAEPQPVESVAPPAEPSVPEPPRPRPTARVRSSWLPRARGRSDSAPENERQEPPSFLDASYRPIPPRETDLPTGSWPDFEAPPSAPSESAITEGLNEPAHEQPPTLVRRYESGGVSYQLYSDGSIEAQTESGSYRFSSLEELRAFIETKR